MAGTIDSRDPVRGHGRYSTFHSLDMRASVDVIWREIENFGNWPTWNPLYIETDGTFVEGSDVRFTVVIPGLQPQKGRATVLFVVPGKSVTYRMRSMGGLLTATRIIELYPDGDDVCAIVNVERMGGLLSPLLFRMFADKVRRGLQGMNEALKERLE